VKLTLKTAAAFSLSFGVIYQLCVFFNFSAFKYYPSIGRLSLVRLPAGNAIQWYGWLTYALIGALIVTAIASMIPSRPSKALTWLWIVPVAVMVFAVYIVTEAWWIT
jgi:hypothetical protein